MQNRLFSICMLLSALLVPGMLFAQTPSSVTGIQAVAEDGVVTVSWDAPVEEAIASYRVFYSGQSILENDGLYDDFEATPGAVTSYTLEHRPTSRTIYVSVLGVNAEGVEGDIFVEEAVVLVQKNTDTSPINPTLEDVDPADLPEEEEKPFESLFNIIRPTEKTEVKDQADVVPMWEEVELEGKFHLLLTDVVSPTELHLIFSARPFVEPAVAPQAFKILDSEGNILHIESILIDGEEVTVRTKIHVPGRTYTLTLSEPLRGEDGSPLDEENRQSTFIGHEDGEKAPEEVAQIDPAAAVQDQLLPPEPVQNLRLEASSVLNGTYFVKARWDVGSPGNISFYSVRQSRDGGQTFGAPNMLDGNVGSIDIPGVTPGEYGIGVRTLNNLGFSSPEVFVSVRVGPQAPPPPPQPMYSAPPPIQAIVVPSIPRPPAPIKVPEPVKETSIRSKNLSQSGAGILTCSLMGLGMAMGWKKRSGR